MDLSKILAAVENKEELIKQIESELGKDYVPRSEFNAKNTELRSLEKQIGELNTNIESLTKEKSNFDSTISELNGKITSYETASLKARIAHETGIPYDLAGRLTGDNEDAIRKDAETLSKLIDTRTPLPPLKSTEPPLPDGKDTAYKALLSNIKGE